MLSPANAGRWQILMGKCFAPREDGEDISEAAVRVAKEPNRFGCGSARRSVNDQARRDALFDYLGVCEAELTGGEFVPGAYAAAKWLTPTELGGVSSQFAAAEADDRAREGTPKAIVLIASAADDLASSLRSSRWQFWLRPPFRNPPSRPTREVWAVRLARPVPLRRAIQSGWTRTSGCREVFRYFSSFGSMDLAAETYLTQLTPKVPLSLSIERFRKPSARHIRNKLRIVLHHANEHTRRDSVIRPIGCLAEPGAQKKYCAVRGGVILNFRQSTRGQQP